MEVENVLQKFCKQIFALTDDPQFPYCLRGSGVSVQIAGRHFLFCCRHQIHDFVPDKIAIRLSFETKIMSASNMRELIINANNRDDDTIDVAAFEFCAENYRVPNLTSEFFPIDSNRIWPFGTAQLPFMIFGYPSTLQMYDDERIGARCIELKAIYDGGSNSPHLHRVKLEKAVDADGMSGGPVFYIGGRPGSFFAGFAGMVMRGGRNSNELHFIAADFLIQMALESSVLPWS